MKRTVICLGALFAFALSGCSTTSSRSAKQTNLSASTQIAPPLASEVRGQFDWKARATGAVAPGYEIELSNPADEQLNGRFRVGWDGVVKLPYDIRIDTTGLTEKSLRQKIISAYTNFFQTTPTMNIAVTDKKYYVDVRGLVQKPGQYLMREDSSLDEVVAAADGYQQVATKEATNIAAKYVRIIQGNQVMVMNLADYYSGSEALNPKWQGGEIVFFQSERGEAASGPAGNYVQALGQIKLPGEYQYRPDADVLYYLVKAGGPVDQADLGRIEIIRTEGAVKRTISVSLEDMEEGRTLPQVMAGDVILFYSVQDTKTERRTRFIAEIAGIITSIATVVIAASTL